MTSEYVYEIWRPSNSPWAQWVKGVVFAFLRPQDLTSGAYSVWNWPVLLDSDAAIIVDLPGAEGVSAGIAAARAGYRPVVLYNACPSAMNDDFVEQHVVVDMASITAAICATTKELASFNLPAYGPPAFLLDANRRGLGTPDAGWFDNRSFVTSSDFPSADYFRLQGISKIILIQTAPKIGADLLQILVRLQRDGMSIAKQAPWTPWAPSHCIVRPPMLPIAAFQWLSRKLGYRRNSLDGSFGALVPPSSS